MAIIANQGPAGHSAAMRRDENRVSRQWGISGRRGETLLADLDILLGEMARAGFCGVVAADVLPDKEPLTADAFAVAVVAAEGWPEPETEYHWRPNIAKLFTERYGPSISAAEYEGSGSA